MSVETHVEARDEIATNFAKTASDFIATATDDGADHRMAALPLQAVDAWSFGLIGAL